MPPAFAGLWPPVATPFAADGTVNIPGLVRHGRTLLEEGAHGLAILGTTSEANSLTLAERRRTIDALVEAGIPADSLLPGTGACAIADAVELTRRAGDLGCAGVLLLPPFYYKGVSDDGLFRFVATVIERVGGKAPRIMLYHIPPMAIVGWSADLVGRLMEAFPKIVVGMKDSSGDYEHTKGMIKAFPDLAVFPGAEVYLKKALGDGAVGCISATANINARGIRNLLDGWRAADAEALQSEVTAVRKAVQSRGMIPSIKALLARRYRDDSWVAVRPPLVTISEASRAELLADPAIVGLLGTVDA
jgi:4-hydroxy-tetrahydrodipicolinate synthase